MTRQWTKWLLAGSVAFAADSAAAQTQDGEQLDEVSIVDFSDGGLTAYRERARRRRPLDDAPALRRTRESNRRITRREHGLRRARVFEDQEAPFMSALNAFLA